MKDYLPKHLVRKLLRALLPTLLAFQIVMRNTLNTFSYGFLVTYLFILFLLWKIEDKKYIRYYALKCLEMLFYFLPISAIIFSFVLTGTFATMGGDSIATAGSVIGGAIGGGIFTFVAIIIGIVGGLILRFTNKKPAVAKEPTFESKTRSYGMIIIYVIIASIVWGMYGIGTMEEGITDNPNTSEIVSTVVDENDGETAIESDEEIVESDSEEQMENTPTSSINFLLSDFRVLEGDFSKHFEFDVALENLSEREILGFKGSFEVIDIFDDRLAGFNIEEIGAFGVGEQYSDTRKYSMNEFMSDQVKLSELAYEDLKYNYTIEEIIYSDEWDSENKLQSKATGRDIEGVEFYIDNKSGEEGRFGNNAVLFDIRIVNNSGRNIRGIKGSYDIYNMFGEELGGYEVNTTESIASGATYTETMRYSVNQFINDEQDIYDTDFDFLKYSFDIEQMIYE